MKFYKFTDYNQLLKLVNNKFPFIYHYTKFYTAFYNNDFHNIKNAAVIYNDGKKCFYLKGRCYGYECNFTKELWRKFIKLQAFL